MIRPQFTEQRLDRSRVEISDDVLQERIARVRPLVLIDGEISMFDIPNLRTTAFTWSPSNEREIPRFEIGVIEVARTFTHHECTGYHGLLKPTIAEVLAQLPNDPSINAFYLDTDSMVICDDGEGWIITCHWLKTTPSLITKGADDVA